MGQKYLHDLTRWNSLSTEAQERIFGRTKLSDIELDDSIKPTSAHNALTAIFFHTVGLSGRKPIVSQRAQ